MRISVIISTYGMERISDTHQAIDSIIGQRDDDTELIVVVDRNDELVSNLKKKYGNDIKIVVSEKRGLSNARNLGVKAAGGDIVAFIDDDATAGPRWLAAIKKGFSGDRIGAVTGDILPDWVEGKHEWVPVSLFWIVSCSYVYKKDGEYVSTAIGTNMAFRRDLLLKLGGFHHKLGAVQNWRRVKGKWVQKVSLVGEERDVCIKLTGKGYKIIHSSEMLVNHKVYSYRLSMKNLLNRGFREGMTKGYLNKKYSKNKDTLSLEKEYLFHAFGGSLTEKDKTFMPRVRGVATLFLVFVSVFLGYAASFVSNKYV